VSRENQRQGDREDQEDHDFVRRPKGDAPIRGEETRHEISQNRRSEEAKDEDCEIRDLDEQLRYRSVGERRRRGFDEHEENEQKQAIEDDNHLIVDVHQLDNRRRDQDNHAIGDLVRQLDTLGRGDIHLFNHTLTYEPA